MWSISYWCDQSLIDFHLISLLISLFHLLIITPHITLFFPLMSTCDRTVRVGSWLNKIFLIHDPNSQIHYFLFYCFLFWTKLSRINVNTQYNNTTTLSPSLSLSLSLSLHPWCSYGTTWNWKPWRTSSLNTETQKQFLTSKR